MASVLINDPTLTSFRWALGRLYGMSALIPTTTR